MRKLLPEVAWSAGDAPLDARLVPLLREIRSRATLRAAAAARSMSYRSAWDLIGGLARALGEPLVALERGRGARLTPLAERLLAADDAARATLAGVRGRLAVSVAAADRVRGAALRMCASHDLLLAELAQTLKPKPDLVFRGSLESVAAFARGEVEIAGFHLPPGGPATGSLDDLLQARRDCLIRFAVREQGLIVARGNPKHIRRPADLAHRGVRFVNRQRGSGTRLLIDQLLRQAHVLPEAVRGYPEEEFTHAAVAASVAAGRADAGIGVRAAAARFGLDFVPLQRERYWLVARRRLLHDARLKRLLTALRGDVLPRLARRLSGYEVGGAGEVCALERLKAEP
jgi:putative molybdopterin biosynthesis protein